MKYAGLLLMLLLACAGHADEKFRCGQRIASSELSPAELLARCGEPQKKSSRSEPIRVRNAAGLMDTNGETVIETWVYDRGKSAAPMVVTIVDGRIKSIERQR